MACGGRITFHLDWSPWILLSGVAARTEDVKLGLTSCRKLVELRPTSPIASSGYFGWLIKAGNVESAIEEMNRFGELVNTVDEEVRIVKYEQREKLQELGLL